MARFEIVGGCRLKRMPDLIAKENYTEAWIRVTPIEGAGIRGMVSFAFAHAMSRPQDTVIICPGVTDILHADPITGTLSLRFTSIAEMTEHVLGLLNEGDTNFHQAFPNSHIIFAPITGLDIKRFPLLADMDPYHQYVVNASMAQINAGMTAINERNHVPTPWTTRYTHKLRKRRNGQPYVQHRYDLLRDGLHPTSKLLKHWAHALVSTVWHCT